jgi:hypothetical protein
MASAVAHIQKLSRLLVHRRRKKGSSLWDFEEKVEMRKG